jgi:hypothetical protein
LGRDLRPSSSTNYSADYEAGNIIDKFYPADSIPEEDSLREIPHAFRLLLSEKRGTHLKKLRT